MAARLSSALLNIQQVVDLLEDGEDDDSEMDDCFFPGSDDELGFDEIELEDEDTEYGNSIITHSYYLSLQNCSEGDGYNSGPEDSHTDESESGDVRCVNMYYDCTSIRHYVYMSVCVCVCVRVRVHACMQKYVKGVCACLTTVY